MLEWWRELDKRRQLPYLHPSELPDLPAEQKSGYLLGLLTVLGDRGVGKSSLVLHFAALASYSHQAGEIEPHTQNLQGRFIDEIDPTLEDCYRKGVDVDQHVLMTEILDTSLSAGVYDNQPKWLC